MKGSQTLSVTTASALKELMTLILSVAYPQVFHCGHQVLAAAGELEQSDDTRLLKSYMDGIYNAIERLFYKERIVLFPYLEKHFIPGGNPRTIPAVTTSIEEGDRASKMIQSFKTALFNNPPEVSSKVVEEQLLAAFQVFEKSWEALSMQRIQVFTCFVPDIRTKV